MLQNWKLYLHCPENCCGMISAPFQPAVSTVGFNGLSDCSIFLSNLTVFCSFPFSQLIPFCWETPEHVLEELSQLHFESSFGTNIALKRMPGNPQIAFLRHQFSTAPVTLAASLSVISGPLKSYSSCSYFSDSVGSQILTKYKFIFCGLESPAQLWPSWGPKFLPREEIKGSWKAVNKTNQDTHVQVTSCA